MIPTNLSKESLFLLKETKEGTVLHLATEQGQESLAEKIIALCPSLVTSTNSKGDTPLHLAARLGRIRTLTRIIESMKMHTLDDPKNAEMMNKNGLTPLHCAAMEGSVEIIREFLDKDPRSFDSVTRGKKETVFHIAARHNKEEAFIFMAKSAKLSQLLYQVDVDGNNVLHVAASVGSLALVNYIIEETKIQVTTKNNKGFAAVDLLNKNDEDFIELSTALMRDTNILVEPSNLEKEVVDEVKKFKKHMGTVQNTESFNEREMQVEALRNARNTIIVVAILIASVTFNCGINPPGGLYQEGEHIGKSTAGRRLSFMIFSISNSIALFTSVSIAFLLLSVIPYKETSLMKFLVITHWMLWVAVAAMASAYVAAIWVTSAHFGSTRRLFYLNIAIAVLTLGGMFVYLQYNLIKCIFRNKDYLRDGTSPPVTKNRCRVMAANYDKGYYSYC